MAKLRSSKVYGSLDIYGGLDVKYNLTLSGVDPIVSASSTGTLALFNTNLSTVNAFGSTTALTLGATTGTITIRNSILTLSNATTLTGAYLTSTTFGTDDATARTFDLHATTTIGSATNNKNLTVNGAVYAGSVYDNGSRVITSATLGVPSAITTTVETASETVHYPTFTSTASGTASLKTANATRILSYVPSTGQLNSSSFNASSARALKTNIYPTKFKALEIINNTLIVDFNFKHDETLLPHIGFIADDTHEILATRNHDSMDMGNSIGILLKAVQELHEENKALKKELTRCIKNPFTKGEK